MKPFQTTNWNKLCFNFETTWIKQVDILDLKSYPNIINKNYSIRI
jgi:hypothetical protein